MYGNSMLKIDQLAPLVPERVFSDVIVEAEYASVMGVGPCLSSYSSDRRAERFNPTTGQELTLYGVIHLLECNPLIAEVLVGASSLNGVGQSAVVAWLQAVVHYSGNAG